MSQTYSSQFSLRRRLAIREAFQLSVDVSSKGVCLGFTKQADVLLYHMREDSLSCFLSHLLLWPDPLCSVIRNSTVGILCSKAQFAYPLPRCSSPYWQVHLTKSFAPF